MNPNSGEIIHTHWWKFIVDKYLIVYFTQDSNSFSMKDYFGTNDRITKIYEFESNKKAMDFQFITDLLVPVDRMYSPYVFEERMGLKKQLNKVVL